MTPRQVQALLRADYAVVKSAKDAVMLYCEQCDSTITENHFWPLNKSKGLHQRGSGHKLHYIGFRERPS